MMLNIGKFPIVCKLSYVRESQHKYNQNLHTFLSCQLVSVRALIHIINKNEISICFIAWITIFVALQPILIIKSFTYDLLKLFCVMLRLKNQLHILIFFVL